MRKIVLVAVGATGVFLLVPKIVGAASTTFAVSCEPVSGGAIVSPAGQCRRPSLMAENVLVAQATGAALGSQTDPATSLEVPQAPIQGSVVGAGAQSSAETSGALPSESAGETLTPVNLPPVATLNEFLMNGSYTSVLGIEVREGSAPLADGTEVEGLVVQSVLPGSPAARAGIQPYRATTHYLIDGAFAAASLVFPPAMLVMAAVDQSRIGTSFDLVIGVDGVRVTNVLEFDDQVRNVKPGDIVYLNIVRGGKRLQIPVEMPSVSFATAAAKK